MAKESALSRYEAMRRSRDPFLRRARDCAELTLPALMPPEGHSASHLLPEPYQWSWRESGCVSRLKADGRDVPAG